MVLYEGGRDELFNDSNGRQIAVEQARMAQRPFCRREEADLHSFLNLCVHEKPRLHKEARRVIARACFFLAERPPRTKPGLNN
jgi:hypothetical protein